MKRVLFIGIMFLMLVTMNGIAIAETLKGSTEFIWDKLTQTERDADISQIMSKVVTEDIVLNYDKTEFQNKYEEFKKDKNNKINYISVKLGKNNFTDRIIVPFYAKKILYGYGIIYKNDLKTCYYYTAMGGLFSVELFEKDYNDYPVASYQYDKKGRLTSAVYSLSQNDEYMFTPGGIFLGRWYGENYYTSKGKVMMTRHLPE